MIINNFGGKIVKDVKDGTELLKISDNVYRNEKNGNIYIYCTEQVLEEDNFNSELRKIYQERAVRTSNEDIYIVVDGKLLEDPSCGGPIEKVGINEYRGRYSKNSFMMINDLLMSMKESVSGSEVKLKDDGRYYSEALGKFFTLEKVKDGSFKFIPTFLPYEGMLDVPAKIVDDKLVGENGISFPVEETGYVVTPSKQNLATQEDIDKCIKRDREITEKTLNLLKKDIDINLRARTIAWQIEIAKLKRKGIIDAARKENFQADIMTMNMFRDYQKNGYVDKKEAFNLSMMNGLNYTTQDALVTLGNTRDARKAELSAMLQDSSTTNYVETNSMAK